jgi:hypothetical protein
MSGHDNPQKWFKVIKRRLIALPPGYELCSAKEAWRPQDDLLPRLEGNGQARKWIDVRKRTRRPIDH